MELFRNRTQATLASGMTAIQTTLPLTAGHGARFGTIPTGSRIRIDLLTAANNVAETVYMTAITGDTGTIERGADGSTATTHLAGAVLEMRVGKSSMEAMMQAEDIQAGAESLLTSVSGTNTITATATPALVAQPATGSLWKLPAAAANTGAATLNISGQGALSLVRPDGNALEADDIPAANYPCLIQKLATTYRLLNPANLIAQQLAQANAATATAAQSQTGVAYITTGTATAYVLTPSPAIAANAENISFDVEFHAAAGATPTLAVSGKAALALKYRDASGALQDVTANQIPIGWRSKVTHDGTYWVVREIARAPGTLIAYSEILASDAAWAPNAATKRIVVRAIGPGGAGGGVAASGASGGVSPGGGRGVEVWKETTTIAASYAVVIGSGATPTTFGALASAAPGISGPAAFTSTGLDGYYQDPLTHGQALDGPGGTPGASAGSVGGAAGANTGSGGGGAQANGIDAFAGGAGGSGKVQVWEYA